MRIKDNCSTSSSPKYWRLTASLWAQVAAQQEHAELSELMADFGLENAKGKGVAADDSIEQQFVQSEYNLEQASTRVMAVNDASSELQNLEHFIRSTTPPRAEAVTLTEEIVRQLLEKLNFLQLSFAAPAKKQQPAPAASAAIVDKFRQQQQQQQQLPGPPTPPRPTQTPPRPPSPPMAEAAPSSSAEVASTYLDDLYADEDEQAGPSSMAARDDAGPSTMAEEEDDPALALHSEEDQQPAASSSSAVLPLEATSGPSTSHVTTGSSTPSHATDDSMSEATLGRVTEAHGQAPAPSPAHLPTSPTSVTSPRALSHMDSRRSNESTGSNSLAVAQSKEQSRQLLEKASQKLASLLVNANDKNFDASRRPGDPAVKRAPQVRPLQLPLVR